MVNPTTKETPNMNIFECFKKMEPKLYHEIIYICPFCAVETCSEYFALRHDSFGDCASKTKRETTEGELDKTDNTSSFPKYSLIQNMKHQLIQCSNCLTKYKSLVTFQRHVNMQHINSLGQYKYFCKQCNFSTAWKETVKDHVSSAHPLIAKNEWPKFKEMGNLKKQTEDHHPQSKKINGFKCKICDYQSRDKGSLDTHISSKHTDPHKIKHASNKSADSDQIKWHQCENCPLKFKLQSKLLGHTQICHSGREVPPQLKREKLPQKFGYVEAPMSHVKFHCTDVEWFNCDTCDYRCEDKCDLRYHILTKHDNRDQIQSFQCEKCPSTFKDNKSLQNHLKYRHSDIGWYKCENCALLFNHEQNLEKHLKLQQCIPSRMK